MVYVATMFAPAGMLASSNDARTGARGAVGGVPIVAVVAELDRTVSDPDVGCVAVVFAKHAHRHIGVVYAGHVLLKFSC